MPVQQQPSSAGTSRARLSIFVMLVAAVLIASVVSLVVVTGGDDTDAAAAKRPAATTSASSAPVAASESASAAEARTSPVARNTPAPSSSKPAATPRARDTRKPITYTVKRGDNLTVIAAWFKLHGYGDLYERNKKVIGSDPDLILPGQKITISPSGVSKG